MEENVHQECVSLLFPTRKRVGLLQTLLQNIKDTKQGEVEVLIAFDTDDLETKNAVDELETKYPFAKFFERERQDNHMEGYYNYLAKKSTGDYLMVFNDDAEFVTIGWDKVIKDKAKRFADWYKDRIFYMGFDDRAHGDPMSSFPCIPRETYEVLGFFFNPVFYTWLADRNLWSMFSAVGRVVEVPVKITHKLHHVKGWVKDDVQQRVCDLHVKNYQEWEKDSTITKKPTDEAIGRLRKAIWNPLKSRILPSG